MLNQRGNVVKLRKNGNFYYKILDNFSSENNKICIQSYKSPTFLFYINKLVFIKEFKTVLYLNLEK